MKNGEEEMFLLLFFFVWGMISSFFFWTEMFSEVSALMLFWGNEDI